MTLNLADRVLEISTKGVQSKNEVANAFNMAPILSSANSESLSDSGSSGKLDMGFEEDTKTDKINASLN